MPLIQHDKRGIDPYGIPAARLAREAEGRKALEDWRRRDDAKLRSWHHQHHVESEEQRKRAARMWAGGHMLELLKPSEMEKYRTLWSNRRGAVEHMAKMEAGLNKLEQESGLDLDGDGDVGLPNCTSTPYSEPLSSTRNGAAAIRSVEQSPPSYRNSFTPRDQYEVHRSLRMSGFSTDRRSGYAVREGVPGHTGHKPGAVHRIGPRHVGSAYHGDACWYSA